METVGTDPAPSVTPSEERAETVGTDPAPSVTPSEERAGTTKFVHSPPLPSPPHSSIIVHHSSFILSLKEIGGLSPENSYPRTSRPRKMCP